jgi:hypothetical protein
MLSRLALALGLASLAACAKAGPGQDQPTDAAPPQGHDSSPPIDAPPSDAPPQQQIDASCAPIVMELLTNGNFDSGSLGTGWTETPIVAGDELVASQDAIGGPADTAPNVAWMGGYARSGNNTDALDQDVDIPSGTTSLVLTGSYLVATSDGFGLDTGHVLLVSTTNTPLEAGLDVDDTGDASTWTPFSKTFGDAHAGETVRLRVTTTSDDSYATAFFFDSLSLEATVAPQGCP